ncbi:MAG: hypothetical protein Q8R63_08335 [Ramlibacter sp.]|nr:hypothetical protein [Ramlibacter sp.]
MDEIRESLSEWVNDEHANTQERDLRDYVAMGLLQSIEEALPSQGDEWLRSEVLIDNLVPPDLSRFKIDVSFTPPGAQADVAQVAPAAVRQVDVPKVASRAGLYIQNRIASLSVLSKLLGPDDMGQRSAKSKQEVAQIMNPYSRRVETQTHGLVSLIGKLPDENEKLQLLFQLTTRLNSLGVRCTGGPLEMPAWIAAGEALDRHVLPAAQDLGDMHLEAANNLRDRLINSMTLPITQYRRARYQHD